MTTTIEQIGWGSYDRYEGPFFRGNIRYSLPTNPSFEDKCLRVVTSTEGGAYDAINMYDRCIVSVGLIQWCEANYSVSRMLGRCLELDSMMFETFRAKFPLAIGFKKNDAGVYRFYSKDFEVTTAEQQRSLFFGSPLTGFKGTWNDATKKWAKAVAVWFANFWDYPLFRTVQAEFTKAKLPGFLLPEGRKLLFTDTGSDQQISWEGALRAAFYSFAANLPAVANKSIIKASNDPAWEGAAPQERFRIALQAMTFGPGISIYPARYKAIAPVLNSVFGIQAPLAPDELKIWGPVPKEMHHDYSEAELANFSRYMKLSTAVMMGQEGIDVIDSIGKEATE